MRVERLAGFRSVPIGVDVAKDFEHGNWKSKFSKADDLVFPNGTGKFKAHSRLLQDQYYPLFAKLAERTKRIRGTARLVFQLAQL